MIAGPENNRGILFRVVSSKLLNVTFSVLYDCRDNCRDNFIANHQCNKKAKQQQCWTDCADKQTDNASNDRMYLQ